MKKLLSSLLLAALLTTSLAACASGGETADTTAPPAESNVPAVTTVPEPQAPTAEELAFDALPDQKYDYEFRILMRNSDQWIRDMFAEEISGDIISDAVFKRNSIVTEKYGVTFKLIKSSNSNYETDAFNVIQAQTDAYDVIVPHARAAFAYAERGYSVNWNDLNHINLDAAWWDQDARNSFTINDKLFMMNGDISMQSLAQSICMLFNKALFEKYNLEAPYEMVNNGKWTFEELARLSEMCSDDLNGDTLIKPADDLYGYVTYQWVGPIQALYSGGGRLVQFNAEGTPFYSLNTEKNQKVYEDYFKLLDSDHAYMELNRDEKKSIFDCREIFRQSRALFMDLSLYDIELMRDMADDFGIIPFPKHDESVDRYYSNVDSGTNLYIIPITNPDLDRTAVILEALAIKGREEVIPAYYEVALQTKYSRDDISAQMIDRIREGRVYDLGYYNSSMLSHQYASAGYFLAQDANHNFSSFCATGEKVTAIHIKKAMKAYQ